jgi:hypothetical protein
MEGFEHYEEFKKHAWKPIIPKLGFVILVIGLAGELALHPLIGLTGGNVRQDVIRGT